MAAALDGTNGLTFNDATKMGSANSLGMRNILFNADFRINQRGYVSAATLAAGAYGHDRFKAGASGGNYSFTQLNSSTQVTIASGKSLIQVVEDKNVVGGSYVLSWTGTALARVGVNSATPSGTFVVSPILITGQTAGTTMSVEFNAGTLNTAQLELGTVATPFERRPIGLELGLCQRYYFRGGNAWAGIFNSPTTARYSGAYPIPMRATPTVLAIAAPIATNPNVTEAQTGSQTTSFQAPGAGGLINATSASKIQFGGFVSAADGRASVLLNDCLSFSSEL
jgi:hypothetical protein